MTLLVALCKEKGCWFTMMSSATGLRPEKWMPRCSWSVMSSATDSKRFTKTQFSSTPRPKVNVCVICKSTMRKTLDQQLLTALDLGKTIKEITETRPLTEKQVKDHLPHLAKELVSPSSPEYGDMIIKSVDDIMKQAQEIVNEARTENLYRTALDGLKIMGSLLTTQAKLLGHLKPEQKNSVNVSLSLSPQEVAKLADDYTATVVDVSDAEDRKRSTRSDG